MFAHISTPGYLLVAALIVLVAWALKTRSPHAGWVAVFGVGVVAEIAFVGWRSAAWATGSGNTVIMGALPSFLIASVLPFFPFVLHLVMTSSQRVWMATYHFFPMEPHLHLLPRATARYYRWGWWQSAAVLYLNEVTQALGLSSRNTFDPYDLLAITAGLALNCALFHVFGKKNTVALMSK